MMAGNHDRHPQVVAGLPRYTTGNMTKIQYNGENLLGHYAGVAGSTLGHLVP